MSDQDRISPYNINTKSNKQVRRIKKTTQLGDYKLIQYQILQTEIISILRQTVGRITNEILGVRGLTITGRQDALCRFSLLKCHVNGKTVSPSLERAALQ